MTTTSVFETTPLAGLEPVGDEATVALSLQPHTVKVVLRGKSTDQNYRAAFQELTSIEFPEAANTVSISQELSAFWLGPDETLIRFHAPENRDPSVEPEFITRACSLFEGSQAAVVDVSDYYCLLKLQGDVAPQVLQKGSPLDVESALPDSSFCAQTRVGNSAVLLNRSEQFSDLFWVQARWSYTDYVWRQLRLGMQEYLSTSKFE